MSTTSKEKATIVNDEENDAASAKPGVLEQKPVQSYPDPDIDDLDDLDDMLEDFSTKPKTIVDLEPPGPKPPEDENGIGATTGLNDKFADESLAKQLQEGMSDLMKELESSPDMQTQFQTLLDELGQDAAAQVGNEVRPQGNDQTVISTSHGVSTKTPKMEDTTPRATKTQKNEDQFQETIKKTMERLQASGDQATAAETAGTDPDDDFLAEMMRAMATAGNSGSDGTDAGGGEEDFSKMILGMMEQLTNKEILYEPMKELNDKFPEWMEKNATSAKEEDLKRYKDQQVYVREIVERFERKSYKDENASDREFIVDRMQKMQAAGSPPADLVGDMTAAQEAFGAPDEGCNQQ